MICDWQGFLRLIPQRMRSSIDRLGKETLQELRLRSGQRPELVISDKSIYLEETITESDLDFCVNTASQYSPWSASTVARGYITARGGHRIGICGHMVMLEGKIHTAKLVSSLCIRVARDFSGIASNLTEIHGSVLIIGRPGSGKTTLLRDFIRQKSNAEACNIAVVDERCELFPVSCGKFCFPTGKHTDVLSGCGKAEGIEMLVRTMGPRYVAVDEITAVEDCEAIIQAIGCGVSILATAHAADFHDFENRPVYKPILNAEIFNHIVVMQSDKSWNLERVKV